jgi:Asp-tRNA(Asn)/Glu-tRNA(Gln) amidotransferase A subunit family amidase
VQRRGKPRDSDSDIVGRLRRAGAVIIGLTRAPELCLWPMTDTTEAIVRNPSDDAVEAHARFSEELPTMHDTMHLYPIDGQAPPGSSRSTCGRSSARPV